MKAIKKLYQRRYLDVALYNWVRAVLDLFPDTSIDNALIGFYKFYNITVDDLPLTAAKTTYNRMQHEYFEAMKSEGENVD